MVPALAGAALALAPELAVGTVANEAYAAWEELPGDFDLDVVLPGYTTVLDADGGEVAQFYTTNRRPLTREQIPDSVIEALVATEDAKFWEHGGVDVMGVARALASNAATGSRQGGSTITQQLVENLRVLRATTAQEAQSARGQTPVDKLQEMKFALSVEAQYSKDEIITTYLNTVYFESRVYGLATAAHRYFSVPADELTVPQAALLVGQLKAPANYDPFVNPEAAKNRRDTVMLRMRDEGYISAEEFEQYTAQPLGLQEGEFAGGCEDSPYPYYCALVLEEILTDPAFGETREEREAFLHRGRVTLRTALEPEAIASAQDVVEDMLGLDNEYKAGLAVVRPGTGELVAVAQNTEWDETQVVLANSAQQTGSAFKPITLAAAFEQGTSPSLRMNGSSPYFSSLDNPPSGFKNSWSGIGGMHDARSATRVSNNIYFVRLAERTGVRNVAATANRIGLSLPTNLTGREAAITLGSYESTPIEMATAYATFATGGITCDPHTITAVVDDVTGEELPAPDPDCRRTMTAAVADTVTDLLTEPLKPGGTAAGMGIGRPAAGKTGSTNNWAIANFAGYTPQYSTALWVADPTGPNSNPLRGVRLDGAVVGIGDAGSVAAPIWQRTMRALHADEPRLDLGGHPGSYRIGQGGDVAPSLVGLEMEAAVGAAQAAGLEVEVSEETVAATGPLPAGVVARAEVEGDTVTLTMSADEEDAA